MNLFRIRRRGAEAAMRPGIFPPDFIPEPDAFVDQSQDIRHLGGIWWYEAPIPSKFHRCTPQTAGWTNYFDWTERCACGAIRSNRFSYPQWINRNERKGESK